MHIADESTARLGISSIGFHNDILHRAEHRHPECQKPATSTVVMSVLQARFSNDRRNKWVFCVFSNLQPHSHTDRSPKTRASTAPPGTGILGLRIFLPTCRRLRLGASQWLRDGVLCNSTVHLHFPTCDVLLSTPRRFNMLRNGASRTRTK
jgi:hypothetical protein